MLTDLEPLLPSAKAASAETDAAVTFALKEHEGLQEKIGRATEDMYRIETFIPIAMAAIYVWMLKDGIKTVRYYPVILWIPPALAVIGAVRHFARYQYISAAERYTRVLEGFLYGHSNYVQHPRGWEHHLQENPPFSHRMMRYAVWAVLFLFSAIFAISEMARQ